MSIDKSILSGVLLVLAITLASMFMSLAHEAMNPMVISIVFGMLLSNIFSISDGVVRGGEACLRLTLPAGLALYGIQLEFPLVQAGHWQLAVLIIVVMFLVSYLFSRYVAGLEHGLSLLVATGLSFCGAAGVMVMAAIIGARREDTSASILAVVITGFAGMIIYRLLAGSHIVPVDGIALLVGCAIPMLGMVKVAAMAFGEETLQAASSYKLLCMSFLIVLGLVVYMVRRRKDASRPMPWFMVVFMLLAVLSNASGVVASMKEVAGHTSGVLLTAALASAGLSVDIDEMREKAMAVLMSAGVAWGFVSLSMALAFILIL